MGWIGESISIFFEIIHMQANKMKDVGLTHIVIPCSIGIDVEDHRLLLS